MQIEVWYELHCLDAMRKTLYPEHLGGLEALKVNGVLDREDLEFQHWGEESQVARSLFKLSGTTTDHCIDSLWQTLMCSTVVSTIPFHVKIPKLTNSILSVPQGGLSTWQPVNQYFRGREYLERFKRR